MATLLLTAVFLPTVGALLLPGNRQAARLVALAIALAVLGVAVALVSQCPPSTTASAPFALTDWHWLAWAGAAVDVRFSVALDGLSLWLFALTTLLSVVAVLIGWEAIDERASLYYRLLLILETGMLGVFVARDIILFYVFFEMTLIPLFFLIGIWGGPQRRYAAMKFFLFTLAGSLLTLLGLLTIVLWNYYAPAGGPATRTLTFSIPDLTEALRHHPMDPSLQMWVFLALFAGFAVKTPLFPLHTWLPLAHVEAPTAGSVLLAGVLLKVGTYGFARFNLPMLPHAAATLMPWLMWIALAGVVYGALVALAQGDIKRLVAYSSVSHLGFCMLGLFALDRLSVQGGVLQMVNHGLATGGLFAVVGMIYERYHTRQIDDFGGLARRLPVLAFFTLVITLSSIALPGLAGFAGEFVLLLGVFQRGWAQAVSGHWLQLRLIAVLSMSGVVLGAWYMLWMYQRVFFGEKKEPGASEHGSDMPNHPSSVASSPSSPGEGQGTHSVRDLSLREVLCLTPLVVMMFWIGLQPRFFLDRMAPTLNELMMPAMNAVEERGEMRGERGKGEQVGGARHELRSTEYKVLSTKCLFVPPVCASHSVLPTPYSVLRTPYSLSLVPRPSPIASHPSPLAP